MIKEDNNGLLKCKGCGKEIGENEGHYTQNPYNAEIGPFCVVCMEEFKKKFPNRELIDGK